MTPIRRASSALAPPRDDPHFATRTAAPSRSARRCGAEGPGGARMAGASAQPAALRIISAHLPDWAARRYHMRLARIGADLG